MIEDSDIQHLKTLFLEKPKDVINVPLLNAEGIENETRSIQHKGKFYMAMKIRGQWRYFQEIKLAEV